MHHVSFFVTDIDRSIHLFKDLLGFELQWRLPKTGGRKLSAVMGIPEVEAELVYLQGPNDAVAIELVRLIHPSMENRTIQFGMPGAIGLSFVIEDLDALYERLIEEGWAPFTQGVQMMSPDGEPVRIFCFRTDEGVTIEIIEPTNITSHKN
jgi:catechol 2,3-dioxygenase-like lactoylglutathione lyase family enzyme